MRPWICGYVGSAFTGVQLSNSFGSSQATVSKGGAGTYVLTFTSTAPTGAFVSLATLFAAIGFIQITTQGSTSVTVKTFNASSIATDMAFFVQVIAQ